MTTLFKDIGVGVGGSNHNFLDLVEGDLVVGPVIALGCPGDGVGRHLLGFFQCSLVLR
jgi:hypothetical protein